MVVVLIGYPGSQKILNASKYLSKKYLPNFLHTIYLNYKGEIRGWSKYLSTFLSYITDNMIVLALDDYLLADHINISGFNNAVDFVFNGFMTNSQIVCAKLCQSTPEEHAEYPVTTQYCIWNREYLIELLGQINTPWEFEIIGSRLFNKKVIHVPCLKYFTNSSISSRWEGIRLDGLKQEDIIFLKENNYV